MRFSDQLSIVPVKALVPTPDNLAVCAAVLANGGVVGLPTETVYGLAAEASSAAGIALIFKIKGRPVDHPLIIHVADLNQALRWFERDSARDEFASQFATRAMQAFWPGPLTVIVKRHADAPNFACGGQDTVGLRSPSHPIAAKLLSDMAKQGSWGVAAPSANRFGRISPTCAGHVIDDLGDDCAFVLDGGDCDHGIESTILDCSSVRIRILRPGSITKQMLENALQCSIEDGPSVIDSQTPRVSGSLDSHYAPMTKTVLIATPDLDQAILACLDAKLRVGVLARHPCPNHFKGSATIIWLVASAQADQYAHSLYANLRALDCQCLDCLMVVAPPNEAQWDGVADRVKRSAA